MPLLPPVAATRVLGRDRRGGSSPVLVATPDGPHVLKLRGAAQGTGSLVAEVIVGGLADALGLAVPARRVVTLAPETPTDDRNDELADLLNASRGENLGFRHLADARHFTADDRAHVSVDFASQVRWLDWLTRNPDRTPENPNILVAGGRFWLIDHAAALSFQHDWRAVTEETPLSPEAPRPHVFDGLAARLVDWDPILTGVLTRECLTAAVAEVPSSFLAPLVARDAGPDAIARRRAAYVAVLWKRLRGSRAALVSRRDPDRGAPASSPRWRP